MTIEPISGGRLRVWLDQREIRRCRLNHDHYDRRALRRLVRRVLVESGGEPTARSTAEMIPVADGWVLLVSPRRERTHRTAVYWFADEGAMDAFTAQWERIEDAPTCGLYALEGGYALTVRGDSELTPRQRGLLDEYGHPWGEGEPLAAHVAEYGRLLCAGYLTADGRCPPTERDREN